MVQALRTTQCEQFYQKLLMLGVRKQAGKILAKCVIM